MSNGQRIQFAPAACRPILVDFDDAGGNLSSPFPPGLTFGSYRTGESRRLIPRSKTLALNQPRTIVPQSFSVKRQLWGVPKQIGADKERGSRTLGEAVGAEITQLRVRSRMEPVKIGARSGIYRTLHRPTGTRHQEPNATNARRSRQSFFHRGFHHTQSCGASTPEQWKALIFTP